MPRSPITYVARRRRAGRSRYRHPVCLMMALLLVASSGIACSSSSGSGSGADPARETSTVESVEMVWLGVSNWLVRVGSTTLLFDAYYSRPAFGGEPHIDGMPQIQRVLQAAGAEQVDAILIGHAHFDHISDLGATALFTGAQAVGTPTTCFVAQAQGLRPERCTVVGDGDLLEYDDVSIRVVRNGHWWPVERGPGPHAELTEPPDPEQSLRTPHGGAISFVLTVEGREDLTVFMQNTGNTCSTWDFSNVVPILYHSGLHRHAKQLPIAPTIPGSGGRHRARTASSS